MSIMSYSKSSLWCLVYFLQAVLYLSSSILLYLRQSMFLILFLSFPSRCGGGITSNWCLLPWITPIQHKKQFPLYKGIPRAITWTYEQGFWTAKEVCVPFVHSNVAPNLSFKYWSDALLGLYLACHYSVSSIFISTNLLVWLSLMIQISYKAL